jgi:cysteine synthase
VTPRPAKIRRLARESGLFVGPSSGANLLAARELRARDPALRNVVTFGDEREKYIND